MLQHLKHCRFALAAIALAAVSTPAFGKDVGPNSLQQAMLFRSFIQDAPECAMSPSEPWKFAPGVASPAATCPDAFAWTQFATAIRDKFWNWGIDQTVWPAEPWALCKPGQTENCCNPKAKYNPDQPPPTHCPYDRADFNPPSPLPATPNGTPSFAVINHRGLTYVEKLDPGRLLRDLELELVFRNKSMIKYIYEQDLYNTQGLGARNRAQNNAIGTGDLKRAQRLQVRFPTDAVMVKVDFIHQDIMLADGLIRRTTTGGETLDPPQNPDYPYVTVYIEGTGEPGSKPGLYYLVAMTNASKALPIWHWYAMEHVANLGRCDYIGCNDSFGYEANGKSDVGKGTARSVAEFGTHYIPPMIGLNNDRMTGNDPVFITGKVYDPNKTGDKTPTWSLRALLETLKVGVAKKVRDYKVISQIDPAWNNYRLKGTQTTFTEPSGVPSGTGATVTEGGFVNSASCTTCHSQASADRNGKVGTQGVGSTWRPNLFGYGQVAMGSPDMAWFYAGSGLTTVTATQVDFVWGTLNANCVKLPPPKNKICASIPKAPTLPGR